MRHCAHQGGSISPLMIFTTCDASANSVAAIAKVTLIRCPSDDRSRVTTSAARNRRGAIENDRSIFRHAFRYSTNCHLDLRIAFGSTDSAARVIGILLDFERGLVVVAIAEDRSGYVVGVKVHNSPQLQSRFKKAYCDPG